MEDLEQRAGPLNSKKSPEDSSSDGPDREPLESYTYNGPRYPDDSDGPNATVYSQGHAIYHDGGWISDGYEYSGKGCAD